ncbi:polymorphic toxin type 44 domain-containing protein [Pseudomonas brassicacearum]|nr:polymorphic toxin type 44 domain-containing protein [Pseudomonas brassicacearum]
MQNQNQPPKPIDLPTIVIRPEPLPIPTAPVRPGQGTIAKPIPWNGKTIEIANISNFFKRRDIKSPSQAMTIIFTIATQQRSIEQAYASQNRLIRSDLNEEISSKLTNKPTISEQLKHQKVITDNLLLEKKLELKSSQAKANHFYRRPPLNKDHVKNAVDFANTFHKSREPALATYNSWLSSITAAYTAKMLSEKVKVLTEDSRRLASQIAETESKVKQAAERANSGVIPASPTDVSLAKNIEEAQKLKEASKLIVGGGEAVTLGIFYTKVRNKGEWDYKQRDKTYEDFGNFNYGATGTAAGIPEQVLLRAAGAAQSIAGTSDEKFGNWWTESPYGDDEIDQIWITAGIKYAKSKDF